MKIIALVGRSGSGKSAVADILTNKFHLPRIKTCTTRKQRFPGEFYDFLSIEEFSKRENAGDIVLADAYAGNLYGTPVENLKAGGLIILEPQGVKELKEKFGNDCIVVGITAAPLTILKRMQKRKGSKEEISQRLKTDDTHFSADVMQSICDVIIRNDENMSMDEAASLIFRIFAKIEGGEYILRDGFFAKDIRKTPFTLEERLENLKKNRALGQPNTISGIVITDDEEIAPAYEKDPGFRMMETLGDKLLDDGTLEERSVELVGITADGHKLLYFVQGIDAEIEERIDK